MRANVKVLAYCVYSVHGMGTRFFGNNRRKDIRFINDMM